MSIFVPDICKNISLLKPSRTENRNREKVNAKKKCKTVDCCEKRKTHKKITAI